MQRLRRVWVGIAFACAALCLVVAVRRTRLLAFAQHQQAQRYEDTYYLPNASWLPVLSFGYRQAWADLIWCKSLVYFGEDVSHRGVVRHVFEYTDAIVTLDPSFRAAYRWVATAAIYRPTAIDMDAGLKAADYLKRAVQIWPNDGELHWDYGSLLRFELAPLEKDAGKKRKLLERAAPHIEAAARMGAGPPWLALNSADLLNKLGRTEQAIRHLQELYGTVRDETVKKEIEERLAQLRTHSYVESMREANNQFERDWQESYPYLSPGLFMFVGTKLGHDTALYQFGYDVGPSPVSADGTEAYGAH